RVAGADQCQPDFGQSLLLVVAAGRLAPPEHVSVVAFGGGGRRPGGRTHLAAGEGALPLRAPAPRRSQPVRGGRIVDSGDPGADQTLLAQQLSLLSPSGT